MPRYIDAEKLKQEYVTRDNDESVIFDYIVDQQPEVFPLNDLADEIHDNAIKHGWWAETRSFGEIVALCHSELSEALEEYRNGKPELYYKDGKPEGIAVEMIDCMIRILDWCGHEEINVDMILRQKHEYNKTRPYKHGGKRI